MSNNLRSAQASGYVWNTGEVRTTYRVRLHATSYPRDGSWRKDTEDIREVIVDPGLRSPLITLTTSQLWVEDDGFLAANVFLDILQPALLLDFEFTHQELWHEPSSNLVFVGQVKRQSLGGLASWKER